MVKLVETISTKKLHLLKDTQNIMYTLREIKFLIIEIKILKDCFDRSVSPER